MYNGRYGSPGVKLASVHLDNFKVLQILPFLSEVCFPIPLSLPPPLSLFLFIINEIFHELSSLLALLTVRLFCLAKLSPSFSTLIVYPYVYSIIRVSIYMYM